MITRQQHARRLAARRETDRGRRGNVAAFGMATLGFASAAGAAGNAPKLVKPLGASPSTYLAGYQDTPTGGLASASVTFTVPKITCTTSDKNKSAIEWNGVYTDSLQAYAFVAGYCTTSGTKYDWVFATDAGPFDEPGAAAGDVVVASLFQSSSSTYAEIHDLTANVFWFANNSVNQGDTTVDIGTYNQSPSRPVPTFSTVKFTNATVNGDYAGLREPNRVQRVERGRPPHQDRPLGDDRHRLDLLGCVQARLVTDP